jgi:Zn-dependent peptidase ImmA (M78 family)
MIRNEGLRRRPILAKVKPAVLRWARETAGVDEGAAARRAGVSVTDLERWEEGYALPSLRELQELAGFYARSLATLLLPEPPAAVPEPVDFRTMGRERPLPLGRETRISLRTAGHLQQVASELSSSAFPTRTVALQADPESLAASERRALGVTVEAQASWPDVYSGLRAWRTAVESRGALVFQLPLPIREVRGFSLSGKNPPVIVVSSSDGPAPRSFTLFHEYAHLLLGSSGVCLPDVAPRVEGMRLSEERFCNEFAGALLVPAAALAELAQTSHVLQDDRTPPDDELELLARHFRVSRQVLLYRALAADLVSEAAFREKWTEWQALPAPLRRSGGGGRTSARRAFDQLGSEFVGLVMRARDNGRLSTSDALECLSIQSRHWSQLETLAGLR